MGQRRRRGGTTPGKSIRDGLRGEQAPKERANDPFRRRHVVLPLTRTGGTDYFYHMVYGLSIDFSRDIFDALTFPPKADPTMRCAMTRHCAGRYER